MLRVESPYKNWLDAPSNATLRGYDIRWFGSDNTSDEKDPLQAHYIVVAPDLSNLDDVLDFCKEHQDICQKIADNARELSTRVLEKEFLFTSFVNLLSVAKTLALSEPAEGGGKPKKAKGTRKASRKEKEKTRKQKKRSPDDSLILSHYRSDSMDPDMEAYVESTIKSLWKTYLNTRR